MGKKEKVPKTVDRIRVPAYNGTIEGAYESGESRVFHYNSSPKEGREPVYAGSFPFSGSICHALDGSETSIASAAELRKRRA